MSSDDQLVEACQKLGYYTEYVKNFDGSLNRDTVVVEFPCESGKNATLAKDMTAIEQLNLVKTIQKEWSDNAVSCTVYYRKEELPDIKKWLSDHYKHNIKSVSFLLHQDHGFDQAPYEEINKERYLEIKKNITKMKPQAISNGKAIEGLECAGGACPIK